MRRLIWLLFLPGFLCQCNPPVEVPASLIAWTGACLSIPCRYQFCAMTPLTTNKVIISSLTWYLNPVYDSEKRDFSGTVLYKHNAAISPAFAGRVRFLGDLKRDCSLQLSDLRASENGSYGLRLVILNPKPKQEEKKWMTRISVNVMASPPAPQIQGLSELRESILAQAVCSIAYYCPDYPITLTWVGLGHGTPGPTTRMDSGRTQSSLTFTPTWQDHGKNLTCRLSTPAGTPSSESSVVLDVKYAPKDVRVELVTGSQIQEGTTVVLKCSCRAHPPVSNYTWYRNGQHIPEQTQQELHFDKIHPNQSGSYRCEPQNIVGMSESPAITVDVQSDAVSAQGQEPCGNCYQIQTPVIVGLVIGDLVFTLLLIAGVYYCTKHCSKPTDNSEDQKVYMNMPGRVN